MRMLTPANKAGGWYAERAEEAAGAESRRKIKGAGPQLGPLLRLLLLYGFELFDKHPATAETIKHKSPA